MDTLRSRVASCTLFDVDDEAVDLGLGFLADIAVNTTRMVELLEEDDGEEETEED